MASSRTGMCSHVPGPPPSPGIVATTPLRRGTVPALDAGNRAHLSSGVAPRRHDLHQRTKQRNQPCLRPRQHILDGVFISERRVLRSSHHVERSVDDRIGDPTGDQRAGAQFVDRGAIGHEACGVSARNDIFHHRDRLGLERHLDWQRPPLRLQLDDRRTGSRSPARTRSCCSASAKVMDTAAGSPVGVVTNRISSASSGRRDRLCRSGTSRPAPDRLHRAPAPRSRRSSSPQPD